MINQYEVMTKQDVVAELNRYLNIQAKLYELINTFREGSKAEKDASQQQLREIYGSFKEEIKNHYKVLATSRVKRNNVVESYFRAAIDDIHVHISGVGINRITRNGIEDFYSAVYDIGSYANYWMPKNTDH